MRTVSRAVLCVVLGVGLGVAHAEAVSAAEVTAETPPATTTETFSGSVSVPFGVAPAPSGRAPASAAGSFGAPLGFGAAWGDFGVGLYAQTLNDTEDGGLGAGIGFGNAEEAVGLEVGVAFSSLLRSSGSSAGFGEAGSFSAKLHRRVAAGTAIAIGAQGFGRWGDENNDAQSTSPFLAISQMVPIPFFDGRPRLLMISAGIADGFIAKPREDDVGGFGSLALFFSPRFSAIVDYAGSSLTTALSWAPLPNWPLTLGLGATNLNGIYGGDTEVAASLGYGFQF